MASERVNSARFLQYGSCSAARAIRKHRSRPESVGSGEALPFATWEKAETSVKRAELLLVVGTSAVVYPASGLIAIGMRNGARTVEINPQITPVSDTVDLRLGGNAAEILPDLVGVRG
ncbi:MAG: hypothetical protein U5J83_00340 [Bryobacterales bacterium]|nr:hypothetical protein [Bryobacterales bacterium]